MAKAENKEGAWRIREFSKWDGDTDFRTGKKYLYDNERAYLREVKNKRKYAVHFSSYYSSRLIMEQFDGTKWVEISREDFPKQNHR